MFFRDKQNPRSAKPEDFELKEEYEKAENIQRRSIYPEEALSDLLCFYVFRISLVCEQTMHFV